MVNGTAFDNLGLESDLAEHQQVTPHDHNEEDHPEHSRVRDEDIRQRSHLLTVGENDAEEEDVVEQAQRKQDNGGDEESDGQ